MPKYSPIGKTIFNGKLMFKVEHEELDDADITWYVEQGIKSYPDITDKRLELRENASCCGNYERLIYSTFKMDHAGIGAQENHAAYCAWCGTLLYNGLKHRVDETSASESVLYFGKHKGKKLAEVPKDYLQWCLANHSDEKLKKKISVFLSGKPPT